MSVSDGTDNAEASITTIVTANTAPSVSLASGDSDNSVVVGTNVTYTATASDSDGDTLSYSWYVNGTRQTDKTGTSFSYTHSKANSSGDVIKVSVSDGTDSAEASITTIVTAATITEYELVYKLDDGTLDDDQIPVIRVSGNSSHIYSIYGE